MPFVKITPYECERNLLPHLCTKCGVPAQESVRIMWLGPVRNLLMGALLILCPPLFVTLALLLQSYGRKLSIPMCEAHKADWHWRDRLTSYGYLILAVAPYCVAAVLIAIFTEWSEAGSIFVNSFVVLFFYFLAWCLWIFPATILWTRTVRATGLPRRGMKISGVHADFIRALAEDRVRDANPARTAWFGDDRDDFDEDMNWLESVRHDRTH